MMSAGRRNSEQRSKATISTGATAPRTTFTDRARAATLDSRSPLSPTFHAYSSQNAASSANPTARTSGDRANATGGSMRRDTVNATSGSTGRDANATGGTARGSGDTYRSNTANFTGDSASLDPLPLLRYPRSPWDQQAAAAAAAAMAPANGGARSFPPLPPTPKAATFSRDSDLCEFSALSSLLFFLSSPPKPHSAYQRTLSRCRDAHSHQTSI